MFLMDPCAQLWRFVWNNSIMTVKRCIIYLNGPIKKYFLFDYINSTNTKVNKTHFSKSKSCTASTKSASPLQELNMYLGFKPNIYVTSSYTKA